MGLTPGLMAFVLLTLMSAGIAALVTMKTLSLRQSFGIISRAAQDPANLAYYAEANAKLRADRGYRPGKFVVIYGSNLGHHWRNILRVLHDDHVVNRCISNQNMTQLILRFEQDVMGLEPKGMFFTPPVDSEISPRQLLVETHLLCATTEALGIQPLLVAAPPIPEATESLSEESIERAMTINRGVRQLAAEMDIPLLDLFTPLAGEDQFLLPEYCGQDTWPNPRGYRVMTEAMKVMIDSLFVPSPSDSDIFAPRNVAATANGPTRMTDRP